MTRRFIDWLTIAIMWFAFLVGMGVIAKMMYRVFMLGWRLL